LAIQSADQPLAANKQSHKSQRSLNVQKENWKMKNFMYETMYILRPDMGEEQTELAIATYQNLLRESGAEIIETQHRGKRRLAYEIGKYREGIYIQMNYQAPGKLIAVLERTMRISEDVIRYLTIKQPLTVTQAEAATAQA
jgi:small subunit ribosomal protein S6